MLFFTIFFYFFLPFQKYTSAHAGADDNADTVLSFVDAVAQDALQPLQPPFLHLHHQHRTPQLLQRFRTRRTIIGIIGIIGNIGIIGMPFLICIEKSPLGLFSLKLFLGILIIYFLFSIKAVRNRSTILVFSTKLR